MLSVEVGPLKRKYVCSETKLVKDSKYDLEDYRPDYILFYTWLGEYYGLLLERVLASITKDKILLMADSAIEMDEVPEVRAMEDLWKLIPFATVDTKLNIVAEGPKFYLVEL